MAGFLASLKPVLQTSEDNRQRAFRLGLNPAKALLNSADSCHETAKSRMELVIFQTSSKSCHNVEFPGVLRYSHSTVAMGLGVSS